MASLRYRFFCYNIFSTQELLYNLVKIYLWTLPYEFEGNPMYLLLFRRWCSPEPTRLLPGQKVPQPTFARACFHRQWSREHCVQRYLRAGRWLGTIHAWSDLQVCDFTKFNGFVIFSFSSKRGLNCKSFVKPCIPEFQFPPTVLSIPYPCQASQILVLK